MYGITKKEALKFGYDADMRSIPMDIVSDIYRKNYWDKMGLSHIWDEAIASFLFDTGVNCGVKTASKFFQRALNSLRVKNGKSLFNALSVDGDIGVKTVDAYTLYTASRKPGPLLKAINCLRGHYYILIGEKHKKLLNFTYGWFKGRIL